MHGVLDSQVLFLSRETLPQSRAVSDATVPLVGADALAECTIRCCAAMHQLLAMAQSGMNQTGTAKQKGGGEGGLLLLGRMAACHHPVYTGRSNHWVPTSSLDLNLLNPEQPPSPAVVG